MLSICQGKTEEEVEAEGAERTETKIFILICFRSVHETNRQVSPDRASGKSSQKKRMECGFRKRMENERFFCAFHLLPRKATDAKRRKRIIRCMHTAICLVLNNSLIWMHCARFRSSTFASAETERAQDTARLWIRNYIDDARIGTGWTFLYFYPSEKVYTRMNEF